MRIHVDCQALRHCLLIALVLGAAAVSQPVFNIDNSPAGSSAAAVHVATSNPPALSRPWPTFAADCPAYTTYHGAHCRRGWQRSTRYYILCRPASVPHYYPSTDYGQVASKVDFECPKGHACKRYDATADYDLMAVTPAAAPSTDAEREQRDTTLALGMSVVVATSAGWMPVAAWDIGVDSVSAAAAAASHRHSAAGASTSTSTSTSAAGRFSSGRATTDSGRAKPPPSASWSFRAGTPPPAVVCVPWDSSPKDKSDKRAKRDRDRDPDTDADADADGAADLGRPAKQATPDQPHTSTAGVSREEKKRWGEDLHLSSVFYAIEQSTQLPPRAALQMDCAVSGDRVLCH